MHPAASLETSASSSSTVIHSNPPIRIASIDIYRGLVMFLMMAEVLHLSKVASNLPGNSFWSFLAYHQSHVEWIGCSLHDLIQPSFSFLVGVALPFSMMNRENRGQTRPVMLGHAVWRAVLLIFLGVFLRSTHSSQTYWTFEDTLSQIGLGYVFLFLLGFRPMRDQWIALALVLGGYWAAFVMYPLPGPDFDYAKVGVPKDWPHLMDGFAAHWNKNSNLAWAFDTWFLSLFPREKVFTHNGGGYATLSFIPTLGTMIFGLIAGTVLQSNRSQWGKVKWLATAGCICLVTGGALGWLEVCPVVKRIWTPSWTIFSAGWCFLFLAGFYASADIKNHKRWAFPLVVIGTNSIAAYVMAHLFDAFIFKNLKTHFGQGAFKILGAPYEPLVHGAVVLAVFWVLLYWMYRRKLFLKI